MRVTEIGPMGVKPSYISTIMDPSTEAGEILYKAYTGVTSHPAGPYRAYYGLEDEDPSVLWAFFDFDDIDHHTDFAQKHALQYVRDLSTLISHSVFMHHTPLSPQEPDGVSAIMAPATTVLYHYFPTDLPPAQQDAARDVILQQLSRTLSATGQEDKLLGEVTSGWSIEKDTPVMPRGMAGEEHRLKGMAFVCLLGWQDKRAAKEWKELVGGTFGTTASMMEGCMGVKLVTIECVNHDNLARKSLKAA